MNLLELMRAGEEDSQKLWEAKLEAVQKHLQLDDDHMFRTKSPLIDIVIGAIKRGRQVRVRYSEQDPFHCSNDRNIIHDESSKSGHTIDFALEVELSNQIILTLCPLHPFTEVSTTHDEIVKLRQSLDD